MAGTISATAFGDSVQPKKKKPSATVVGKARIMPAIFLFAFSAIKESKAMTPPPTINDMMS